MTKSIFIAAALIAAAAFATDASAATRNAAASRQASAQATAGSFAGDCVRAPNVGAYATAPYAAPPCLPATAR
ncbi:hypothetical protein [Bradyrhizobium ivorense]|uniref:hypothetical protein n=1 Tax=Bradyrhizobium ivorense TaxID=2511166 RepID=UPI0010B882EE|nr:hypothetical protein [Bradyrhizobium ivorense]VIO77556.1 hypothetical protein CI41S_58120 [Bradyrhizobium ivorense]